MSVNIFQLHADVCKTFSNAKRLQIIECLGRKNCSAQELLTELKVSKATLSQQMGVLTEQGVVIATRKGVQVEYELADERITKACNLMREVLISRINKENQVIQKLKRN